ncbi:MAG: plasmid pRiA4b ORF-3 family protein [Gammaproteobacteria bacterium]|nr:plasmid pRiA4b ORF-3 family protein [Gammaproteobacteria bacterium]
MADTVHQLKITLRSVKPPVWRRILVKSDMTLGELAPVLEAVMGWLGGHLHVFDVEGTWYGSADPDWDSDNLDENKYRLSEVLPSVGDKMRWNYDFGDGWEHDVLVEKIAGVDPGAALSVCLAGRRACPPEDCGGPPGYADLLAALADPRHPEHEELRRWAPSDFDPASFDVEDANLALRSPRPFEGW